MLNSAIRLKNSMEAIREKLFTIDEYPFIIRDRLPLDVLDKALKIEALAMPVYAASLGSRQLEALLLDYRGLTSVSAQQKIAAILALRFSKRLLRLIMAIYQYDYNTEAMATLLSAMLNQAHKLQEQPSTGDFIWKFGVTGERYQEIDHFLLQNGKELDRFFADFHINGDSPLADEIKYRYLQHGIKEVLFLNHSRIFQLYRIHGQKTKENILPLKTIEHYLTHSKAYLGRKSSVSFKVEENQRVVQDGEMEVDQMGHAVKKVTRRVTTAMTFDYQMLNISILNSVKKQEPDQQAGQLQDDFPF